MPGESGEESKESDTDPFTEVSADDCPTNPFRKQAQAMNTSPDTIIALMLSAHTSHQAKVEANAVTVTVIRNATPEDRKAVKAKKSSGEQAAPIHHKPQVFGVALPDRNSLDAKGFIEAAKAAGRRKNQDGKFFTDSREVRNDLIQAIHAYIGYDSTRDFGSQDQAARSKAARELSGRVIVVGPTRQEERAASRSLVGFVAGMPNYMAVKVAELTTREQVTVEGIIDAQKVGDAAEVVRLTALLSNVRDELSRFG